MPLPFLRRGLLLPLLAFSLLPVRADTADPAGVTSRPFGETPQGEPVLLHTLTNKNGMRVSVLDYGASIVEIVVPDRAGKLDDVALGFDRLAPYLRPTAGFGAVVGRYAGGSREAASRSATRLSSCQSTVRPTASTAARAASRSGSGRRSRSIPIRPRSGSACSAPTATRATPVTSSPASPTP